MADPATIAALIGGIKSAWDFAKQRADELKDDELSKQLSEVSSKIMDLQRELMALQQENFSLIQAKQDAEAQIKEFRNWEMETAGYKLHEASPGVLVYSKEENIKPTKESPWLCTNCYENREKGFLTLVADTEYEARYQCTRCPNAITVVLKQRSGKSHGRSAPRWGV